MPQAWVSDKDSNPIQLCNSCYMNKIPHHVQNDLVENSIGHRHSELAKHDGEWRRFVSDEVKVSLPSADKLQGT